MYKGPMSKDLMSDGIISEGLMSEGLMSDGANVQRDNVQKDNVRRANVRWANVQESLHHDHDQCKMSSIYSLMKSKGLVKDQKIIPLKMFMNFGNVGIIQVLRFDGILLMFFTHVARPSMSSPIMAKKGSYFTPHTTFTQNALKHEKMHSSSRPFNSKNVVFVFQSLQT